MIQVVLLSAARGAGKTTACQKFVVQAQQMGLRVGGILTPGRFDSQGLKTGIDIVDAHNGERRVFAVLEEDPQRATIGKYHMDEETMQWSLQRILTALSAPIDAVIIDEIGPLELVKKKGFWPALDKLADAQASSVFMVVRPELLVCLQELLQPFQPATVTLSLSNRDEIPARMLGQVWGPLMKRSTDT